jgi:hypothetical protein
VAKWLIVLALACAAGAAGCGGSSRLTKQQFITRADAICTNTQTQLAKLVFPTGNPSTASPAQLKQVASVLDQALALQKQQIADLKKLKPPKDFAGSFSDSLDELSEGMEHATDAADAARNGDGAAVSTSLAAAQSKATEANERAKVYGLKVCGSG